MQAEAIRKAFLDFFQGKEHLLVPSSSLIPAGDPTLLLTSAGMVQFKPYFTGEMTPPNRRLTTVQKCFRVSDIDEVGDASHLTFFEMLGNFSVGDYFKKEGIAWAWEFVTQVMKLPPERLWATVFLDDDEAFGIWQETGVPAERIRRFGEKDNYWGPAGNEGPCGPCSEIHYDFGPSAEGCRLDKSDADCGPNCECGRFLELWNLVFMQFYQDAEGKRTPLPRPNIDTGMGLERAAMILQRAPSVYETDLFAPVVRRVAELAKRAYGQDGQMDRAIRVVAEHARSAAFLIADGVVPDNKGRGYVLRRLIRRAIRFGRKLGLGGHPSTSSGRTEQDSAVRGEPVEPRGVLSQVAEVVIGQMGSVYPELASGREFVLRVLQLEEERFGTGLRHGLEFIDGYLSEVRQLEAEVANDILPTMGHRTLRIFQPFPMVGYWTEEKSDMWASGVLFARRIITSSISKEEYLNMLKTGATPDPEYVATLVSAGRQKLVSIQGRMPGEVAFHLHATYGFPVEITAEIAREHGLEVDMQGFEREMETHREVSRAGADFGGDFDATRAYQELGLGGTRFLGYEATTAPSVVVALLVNGVSSDKAEEGQQVEVVLRETPFYAESGGQVGDTGLIEGPQGAVQVEDTQSPLAGLTVHRGRVARGTVALGDPVTATVDFQRRMDTARNHTATHLLHAALRRVLGTHVRQGGSLVTPERLRFDFTHVSPMSPEELRTVEELVNDRIRANVPTRKRETTYRQAVAEGALAFFGERYGDRVRVLEVPDNPVRGEPVEPRAGPRPSTSSGRTDSESSVHGEPVEPRAGPRPSTGSGRADSESSVHGEPVEPRTDTPKPPSASLGQAFSFEVCGGTHVDATGDIGYCHVTGESSVGAGLRRIEAVTGRAAAESIRHRLDLLNRAEFFLKAADDNFLDKLTSLAEEHVAFRNQLRKYERGTLREQAQELLERVHVQINGIEIVTGTLQVDSAEALREIGDWLRDKLGTGVVVLGAVVKQRPMLLVMVTPDLVSRGLHAGNVVKEAATVIGGGGGGRPEMAQAGGRQADKLDEALRLAMQAVARQASKANPEH